MARIKIKQLDTRIATSGLHMGKARPPKFRRKLQPGEVLELHDENDKELLELLWRTGLVEITLDPATRPLDYATYTEARLCSPTFRSRGPDEDADAEKAREKVYAELHGLPVESEEAPKRSLAQAMTEATAGIPGAEEDAAPEPVKPRRRNRRREQLSAEVST